MSFAKRLKQLRNEIHLTQEELAVKLNKTRSTIAGYETERKEPDYETLKMIANFFNVSLDYLLGASEIRNLHKEQSSLTRVFNNLYTYDLPDEAIKQIEEYIEFVKQKYNKDASAKGKNK